MPRDWKGPFNRRLQMRASERGRRMANRRWELDRERRNKLAALTAVREAVIFSFDSFQMAKRKERNILRSEACA